MSSFERDPKKRRVKPVEPSQQSLLDFDLGESSDDSDFRIEDHCEESDDDSIGSDDSGRKRGVEDEDDDDDDDDDGEEDSDDESDDGLKLSRDMSIEDVIKQAKQRQEDGKGKFDLNEALKIVICCACLGERSDSSNEIVECDECGVTVHEGCYGVSECVSVSSTNSSSSTEPWFCDACKAGMTNPTCELCPNSGGIYKETDVGRWVHLVCALYVPGVAFGEVDRLASVTLFEMPYSKWGSKTCSLCEDERFARTGICIGCDAGMCRTYFHVTCAQKEGLLSEPHTEEVEQADPFYAHCKMHTDKALMRRRRRNWLALQLRMKQRQVNSQEDGYYETEPQIRIKRKLSKIKHKYRTNKTMKLAAWVPTQKMPRLLTTSASACRKLMRKAELMGVDTQAVEVQEAQVAALVDMRKKWHIPPAFSVEFIGYYLDRNTRLTSMKRKLQELLDINSQLQDEQQMVRKQYDKLTKENSDIEEICEKLKNNISTYHVVINHVVPNKSLPSIESMMKPVPPVVPKGHSPSRINAAGKRRSFEEPEGEIPISVRGDAGTIALNECGICHLTKDQHMLAKCDTCHLYYHLNCLNPPLTRMPKKTKLMGWQCSECDKESSGSEVECLDPEAPRKLRHKDERFDSKSESPSQMRPVGPARPHAGPPAHLAPPPVPIESTPLSPPEYVTVSSRKKRRREKRKRYSPDGDGAISSSSSREHKRKRKRKSQDCENSELEQPRIKIKIKPIPLPSGEVSAPGAPILFMATSSTETVPLHSPPQISKPKISSSRVSSGSKKSRDQDLMNMCDVCTQPGSSQNMVRCDECGKCFHFTCLDPPVKKSPKMRGYSWHCADCDPTETDSEDDSDK